jgi:hypothetical protein
MSNISVQQSDPKTFWSSRREASLNWLALGLLLAAWNASDDAGVNARAPEARTPETRTPETRRPETRRPASLRGYEYVSVRAASRITPLKR